jgi:hypothetical protein
MIMQHDNQERIQFTAAVSAFILGMPLVYGLLVLLILTACSDVSYMDWQQVDLESTGTIRIPGDWTFETIPDTAGPDVVIYGPSQEGEERQVQFYCYRSDTYVQAVRNGKIPAAIALNEIASGHLVQGFWSIQEYHNSSIGTTECYFRITLLRAGGYDLISEANAVRPSTALLIALSFESYPNR